MRNLTLGLIKSFIINSSRGLKDEMEAIMEDHRCWPPIAVHSQKVFFLAAVKLCGGSRKSAAETVKLDDPYEFRNHGAQDIREIIKLVKENKPELVANITFNSIYMYMYMSK